MKPAHERTDRWRPLFVIMMAAFVCWSINALVIGLLDFSLPSTFPSDAPWATHFSRLVQLYTSPLVYNGVPVGVGILSLLVWWRTASLLRATSTMGAVCLVWWVGMLVLRVIGGVPVYL